MRSGRNESGMVGGVEGLAFGVLLFVFGTLLVVNAWGVIDAKLATSAAAREAGRVLVEADSSSEGDTAAREIAQETLAGHGKSLSTLNWSNESATFSRCAPIMVTVTTDVPRLSLPLIGAAGGVFSVSSRHTEVVDPYRSDVTGQPTCS